MSKLQYIIDYISDRNSIHTKKLKRTLLNLGEDFDSRAEAFFLQYERVLSQEGRTLDFAIDSYLHFLADITAETILFRETGKYTATSFDDVNRRVYNNPEVMTYHMHALLLSQFLWKHHYEMFCYFRKELDQRKSFITNYLEIGGGHGLQASEALNLISGKAEFTLVDISETSLEIARKMIDSEKIAFILADIFAYEPAKKFDFVTMGEVLEHVEDPKSLLQRASDLMTDDGTLFITTPTNAPTIDHIYLFRNADEIRDLIRNSGFEIVSEFSRYAEDVSPEIAEQYKITLHYGACLQKIKQNIP